MTVLRSDGFGVELDAVDRQIFVLKAHNGAVFQLGGDIKSIRQGIAVNHQRMIASGFKWRGKALEKPFSGVVHHTHFTMNDFVAPNDIATEGLTNCLMPKANAHQGYAGDSGGFCQFKTNTSLIWIAGAGR